mgnify:CR=1 FL=1
MNAKDTGGAAGDVALRTRVGNVGCGRLFDAAQIDMTMVLAPSLHYE